MPGGRRPRTTWMVVAAGAVVAAGVVLAVALVDGSSEPPRTGPEAPIPTPTPAYYLIVDLRRVDEVAVTGRVREREVQEAALGVRETMSGLYGAGFVNTAEWQGGRFPSLYGYFSGTARPQVREDLEDLSLGRTATRLAAVRPDRARVNVRVMVGPTGHPVAAVAGMEFRATGLGSTDGTGAELPIHHRGRYVLRRDGGRWLVVAYDVGGRVGER
jgi:hypothetical protein